MDEYDRELSSIQSQIDKKDNNQTTTNLKDSLILFLNFKYIYMIIIPIVVGCVFLLLKPDIIMYRDPYDKKIKLDFKKYVIWVFGVSVVGCGAYFFYKQKSISSS
jgi:hypothetical protein